MIQDRLGDDLRRQFVTGQPRFGEVPQRRSTRSRISQG